MSNVHKFLKELRIKKKMTLRDAAIKSGLSHSYISSLEQGKHPKTKAPINPSPESLERLSEAYNYPYEELMKMAGYIKENKKERDESAPVSDVTVSVMNKLIDKHGADFSDPEAAEMLEQLVKMVAKMQKKDVN